MSRALLFPLTMMLLIAIAIAMLASALLLPMSDAAVLSGSRGADVVERFYAAVNETIATGDPAALRRVVNPSFADDNPLPGVAPDEPGSRRTWPPCMTPILVCGWMRKSSSAPAIRS